MKVIDDEIYCCTDCLMIIANDDASGMDDATEARCREGIASFQCHLVCNDDGSEDDGFSWKSCEVCNSGLGGTRYRLALLDEDEYEDV